MAFVVACSTKDVPQGEGRTFKVNGVDVAVFNVGGQFHAINNVCAHKGGPLGEGMLDDKVVSCPWHGWKYSVETGKSVVAPNISVPRYAAKVEGDKVLVEV